MKILLAEDDPNIIKIATTVLTKLGNHEVETAPDGITALDMAMAKEYDLLLLDGMMPGLPGIDVCKRYLEGPLPQKAKVIFLSAKSSQEDIKEFLKQGHGYIQKPFVPQNLCQQIDEIMKEVA